MRYVTIVALALSVVLLLMLAVPAMADGPNYGPPPGWAREGDPPGWTHAGADQPGPAVDAESVDAAGEPGCEAPGYPGWTPGPPGWAPSGHPGPG